MPNRPWKVVERDVAALIGGQRMPSNSGYTIDAAGPRFVAQVKHVKALSLEQITQLAESIALEGAKTKRLGIVAAKVRRGVGKESPIVVMMTADTFTQLCGMLAP